MNYKKIIATNPKPAPAIGVITSFEKAKDVRNRVQLSGWDMVVLSFSMN